MLLLMCTAIWTTNGPFTHTYVEQSTLQYVYVALGWWLTCHLSRVALHVKETEDLKKKQILFWSFNCFFQYRKIG